MDFCVAVNGEVDAIVGSHEGSDLASEGFDCDLPECSAVRPRLSGVERSAPPDRGPVNEAIHLIVLMRCIKNVFEISNYQNS